LIGGGEAQVLRKAMHRAARLLISPCCRPRRSMEAGKRSKYHIDAAPGLPARQRSWSAQERGSARTSVVTVRSAGAVPSRRAEMIRGERKASDASSRTCRSTLPSRRAIAAILLSFAQFEREVIGERVRDKIAASKRRGIW